MLTPAKVEEGITNTLRRLEEAVQKLAVIGDEAASAEVSFKVAFSRARLKAKANGSKVSVAEAEDEATIATGGERLAYKIAENQLSGQKELVRALMARLSAMQTLSAGVRQLT